MFKKAICLLLTLGLLVPGTTFTLAATEDCSGNDWDYIEDFEHATYVIGETKTGNTSFQNYFGTTAASGNPYIRSSNIAAADKFTVVSGMGNKSLTNKSIALTSVPTASNTRKAIYSNQTVSSGLGANYSFIHFTAKIQNNDGYTDKEMAVLYRPDNGSGADGSVATDNFLYFKKTGKLELPSGSGLTAVAGASLRYSPYTMYKVDYIVELETKMRYVYLNGVLLASGTYSSLPPVTGANALRRVESFRISYNTNSVNNEMIVDDIGQKYFTKGSVTLADVQDRVVPIASQPTQIKYNALMQNNASTKSSDAAFEFYSYYEDESTPAKKRVTNWSPVTGVSGKAASDVSMHIEAQAGEYLQATRTNPLEQSRYRVWINGNAGESGSMTFDSPTYSLGSQLYSSISICPDENFGYLTFDFRINTGSRGITLRLANDGIYQSDTKIATPGFDGFNRRKWYKVETVLTNNGISSTLYDIYVDGKKVVEGRSISQNFDNLCYLYMAYNCAEFSSYDDDTDTLTIAQNSGVYIDDIYIGRPVAAYNLNEVIPEFDDDGIKSSIAGVYGVSEDMKVGDLMTCFTNPQIFDSFKVYKADWAEAADTDTLAGCTAVAVVGAKTLHYKFEVREDTLFAYAFEEEIGENEPPYTGWTLNRTGTGYPTRTYTAAGKGGRLAGDKSFVLHTEDMTLGVPSGGEPLNAPYLDYTLSKAIDGTAVFEISVYIDDLNSTRYIRATLPDGSDTKTLIAIEHTTGNITAQNKVIGFAREKRWYHFALVLTGGSAGYQIHLNGERVTSYYSGGIRYETNGFTMPAPLNIARLRVFHEIPLKEADQNGDRYVLDGYGNTMTAIDDMTMYYADLPEKPAVTISSEYATISRGMRKVTSDDFIYVEDFNANGTVLKYSGGNYTSNSSAAYNPGDVVIVRTADNIFEYFDVTDTAEYGDITVDDVSGTASLEVFNCGGDYPLLIAASYNTGNNSLKSLNIENTVTATSDNTHLVTVPVGNSGSVRLFAWEDLNSMRSISKAAQF